MKVVLEYKVDLVIFCELKNTKKLHYLTLIRLLFLNLFFPHIHIGLIVSSRQKTKYTFLDWMLFHKQSKMPHSNAFNLIQSIF